MTLWEQQRKRESDAQDRLARMAPGLLDALRLAHRGLSIAQHANLIPVAAEHVRIALAEVAKKIKEAEDSLKLS